MKLRMLLWGLVSVAVPAGTTMVGRQADHFEFAVTSIKPNSAGDHRSTMEMTPGRLAVKGATLKELIRTAYRVDDFQIIGGPEWMSSARWDVEGKADESVSQSQINGMFQNLLVARFRLKAHKERRTVPVYDLVVARNGPKFQQAKPESTGSRHNPGSGQNHGTDGHAGAASMTMAQLAQMLGQIVGRTVIDKTGLSGNYNVRLSWRPEPGQASFASDHGSPGRVESGASNATDPSLASIFTAVQEQLGLKLESAKGPGEVMVIDSAQKPVEQR